AVKTADCLPLLFAAQHQRFVMAIHAGWRGVAAGIIKVGVDRFRDLGGNPVDLTVAIGPAICHLHYEVGPDVAEKVCGSTLIGLAKSKNDRWYVDLSLIAVEQLLVCGVHPENIEVMKWCTYESAQLASYRRSGHTEMANWSWIKP